MDDVARFLGLERTADPARTRLEIGTGLTSTMGSFFGGAAMAAAIVTLEATTGRPCVWATGQFASVGRVGETVDYTAEVEATGRTITHARATGDCDGRPVITVLGAFGARSFDRDAVWLRMPEVPPPAQCPRREMPTHVEGSIHHRVDLRVAAGRQVVDLDGTPGDGTSALWARLPGGSSPSAASLAIVGDFLGSGLAQALGVPAGGTSLDNTVRVVRLVASEWVLLDTRIDSVVNGFAHGRIHLWAEDGTLLGTAEQTVAMRWRREWLVQEPPRAD